MSNIQTRARLIDVSSRTPPINPAVGEIWVDISDSTTPSLKVWNGVLWYQVVQDRDDSDRLVEIIVLG